MSIIDKVKDIVRERCTDEWDWTHISNVVKHSKILAKKLNADEEIAEIGAWLHDITRITGDKDNHHITGAKEAEKILLELDYPKDRIEKVKHCIIAHRGNVKQQIKRETKEADCVASADAMTHFDTIAHLLYLVYTKKGLSLEDGKRWVLDKLIRSWNKMIPEAKELCKEKYKAAKIILS